MTDTINRSGLTVDSKLGGFLETEVLGPLGRDPAAFWSGFAALLDRFVPQNRALLARRDDLQAQIDAWHIERRGQPHDPSAYREFLEAIGLEFKDDGFRTPSYDEVTFETTRPGVYIAGTVCGGDQTSRWFIENGRFHARQIAKHIASGRAERVRFEAIHWKTEE